MYIYIAVTYRMRKIQPPLIAGPDDPPSPSPSPPPSPPPPPEFMGHAYDVRQTKRYWFGITSIPSGGACISPTPTMRGSQMNCTHDCRGLVVVVKWSANSYWGDGGAT